MVRPAMNDRIGAYQASKRSVSVIIPTIQGREDHFARCYHAYAATLVGYSFELVWVVDWPNWPAACNEGFRRIREGEGATKPDSPEHLIHYTADDLVPHPGWFEAACLELCEGWAKRPTISGETFGTVQEETWDRQPFVPAPYLYDADLEAGLMTDRWISEVAEGDHGTLVAFSRIPTLTFAQAERVGPWPEIDYYADCWLGEIMAAWSPPIRARKSRDYAFTHHWAQVGRLDSPERMAEAERLYALELQKLGLGR